MRQARTPMKSAREATTAKVEGSVSDTPQIADAKGERENCRDGEAGGFAKLAESEATVRENRMQTVLNAFLANHPRILAPAAKEFPCPVSKTD
jgi:hypothetical protein